MTLPALQFYPGSWRGNDNLRRCSWGARGVWIECMCLMHAADEYGVLRWPLAEIAHAIGAPVELLHELAQKGTLKGSDRFDGVFEHSATHARKAGAAVTLVRGDGGPCWYSSRMVIDSWRRSIRGRATRFQASTGARGSPSHSPDSTPSRAPTQRHGERLGDGTHSPSHSPDSAPSHAPTQRQGDGPLKALSSSISTNQQASNARETEPTPEARACVLMKESGCKQTNPAHPDLVAALAEGVTLDTLAATAREGVAMRKRNPFAWAIATARARHAEGARPAVKSKSSPPPTPSPRRAEDREPRKRMGPDSQMPQTVLDVAKSLGLTGVPQT